MLVSGKEENMSANKRIKSLQDAMIKNQVEMVAIGPTTNMRYLLGFSPFADERPCVLFLRTDDAVMVVPSLNVDEVAAHAEVKIIPWKDADGPGQALKQVQDKWGSPRVIAVDNAMRADNLLMLLEALSPGRVIPAAGLLALLRVVKSRQELEMMTQAAAQADQAMQAAVDSCFPGVAESEIAWAAESSFRNNGAEEVCFTIVASGPNGAFPHHHSGDRKLREGDTIIIDIGASNQGYKSDITRVVQLGKPDQEVMKVYETVKEANLLATSRVRPGVTAESVDVAAREYLEGAGYGDAFIHRTGHGIGLDVHESPWIMEGDKTILEPGMVFSIEPGVYLPGKFGIRLEDIVAVTEDGARTLTGFGHSLVIKN